MNINRNEYTIGEEIDFLGGFPFNSNMFNEEGVGLPLIRIRDLLKSTINTYYSGPYSDNYIVEKGQVLIGMDGDFHITKWSNKEALLNQRILKLTEKKKSNINLDYLFYFLQPFLLEVHAKTAATTVKHLSTFDISRSVQKFPDYDVQEKIADILMLCDSVIEQTEASIAKYEAIKKGMMQDLFTRGIDLKTGKLRPKYEDAPEMYKPSELGMIPKEWKTVKLFEIFEVKGGKRLPAGEEFSNGKTPFPYIRVSDMKDGSVDMSKLVYVKPHIEPLIRNYKISKDDLYITIAGTLGLVGDIPDELDQAQLTENAAKLILLDKERDKDFQKYFFSTQYFESQLYREIGIGGGVPKLALHRIESMDLVVAPGEEKIISSKISGILEKIIADKKMLEKYKKIKSGLMQDLLSGKVEVKVEELANQN